MIRKLGFLMTFCLGIVTLAFAAPSAERILSFHSDIDVHADSTMTVTETIRVIAQGDQVKRGIYRDFPTDYKDRWGNRVRVGFEVLEVRRDGLPEPYHVEKKSNGQRIYIGEGDVFLRSGEYTYTIVYKTNRQLGFFKEFDELYWNVTGNGWVFSIDQASAAVKLPKDAAPKVLEWGGYTGPQGSRGLGYIADQEELGAVKFRTTRSLAPYEGLTIYVDWPKGYIQEPSLNQRINFFFQDNQVAIGLLMGLLTISLLYLFIWFLVGRDPQSGTIIPLYEPPDNLSPAVTRYFYKMGFDDKAFTAAIINMAAKGYVEITEDFGEKFLSPQKEFFLMKIGQNEESLTEEEGLIARKLFIFRNEVALSQKNYARISDARVVLQDFLMRRNSAMYFHDNGFYFILGLGFSVGYMIWAGSLLFSGQLVLLSFFMIAILLAINVIFYFLLKARTVVGRKLMDRIEGFKMYLATAEKDRLNLLNPPEQTPELFEKYLPYALALDVEQEWSEQFASVLSRITADSGKDVKYMPRWYTGSSWRTLHQLSGGLGSSFSRSIAAASHPPGSVSAGAGGRRGGGGFRGGGGRSGGGGGGGGGGGW
ncbi:MAG: DUF2207 domain-containing protein [Candidatus Omnitrophica bacterium]|nr:DUF2207 domain-containing protein [Candidatus Omnitrophota bacterium]